MNSRCADATPTVSFKAFRRFNDADLAWFPSLLSRIDERACAHFSGEGLPDRLVRSLAARRALPVKEVFESFEFFERVRRRTRASVVADLCCGQGLTGMLFAVFERTVQEVILVDRTCPPSFEKVLEAVCEVAPWVSDKVHFEEHTLKHARKTIPMGASVIAVHACGNRTDQAISLGLELGGRIAVMPCCYYSTGQDAPRTLRKTLGRPLATDIQRTYRLEAAGYRVDWTAVPLAITPMNRVLVGLPSVGQNSDLPDSGDA